MGDSDKKSVLSGMHLVITGLAALVTASVAAVGLGVSQGWISGGSGSHNNNAAPSGTTTGGGPQFVVDPSAISYGPFAPADTSVTVTNIGSAPLPKVSEAVTGANASRFSLDPGSCTGSVSPGQNCQFRLTFHPVSGSSNATLVVEVSGAAATRVPITASAIL